MKLTIERQRLWARTQAFTIALLLFTSAHSALGADAAAKTVRIGFLSPSEPPSSMDTVRRGRTQSASFATHTASQADCPSSPQIWCASR
jgi:hypothetical protein